MILIQNAHIMPIVGPELPNGCLLAEDVHRALSAN